MTNENRRLEEKYNSGGFVVLLSKPEANGVYFIMTTEPDFNQPYKYALLGCNDGELIMTLKKDIEIFAKNQGKPVKYSEGMITQVKMDFIWQEVNSMNRKKEYQTTTPNQWYFADEWLDELVYFDDTCYYKLTKDAGKFKTDIVIMEEDKLLTAESHTTINDLNQMLSTYGAKPVPTSILNILKHELDKSPIAMVDPLSVITFQGNTFTISFTVNDAKEATRTVRKLFTGTDTLAGLECNRVDRGDSRELYATKIAHFTSMCNGLIDSGEIATDGLADYVLPYNI